MSGAAVCAPCRSVPENTIRERRRDVMKAVIMEAHENFAVALRDDGEFVRLSGKGYSVGSAIAIKKKNRSFIGRAVAAAASVCLLVAGGGTYNYFAMENYSVVSLDINPSIEYSLNRFDRVVSVKAVNFDGEAIVDGISTEVVSKDIKYALSVTVDCLRSNDYIKEDTENYVFVSVYSKGENNQQTLSDAIEEFSEDSVEVCSVKTVSVTKEEKEEAENLGITAGKLILVNEAVAVMGEEVGDPGLTATLAGMSVEKLTAIANGVEVASSIEADTDMSFVTGSDIYPAADKDDVIDGTANVLDINEDSDIIPEDITGEASGEKGDGEAASESKDPVGQEAAVSGNQVSEAEPYDAQPPVSDTGQDAEQVFDAVDADDPDNAYTDSDEINIDSGDDDITGDDEAVSELKTDEDDLTADYDGGESESSEKPVGD